MPFLVLGPIAQAKMRLAHHRDLTHYLLLLSSEDGYLAETVTEPSPFDEANANHHPTQMENRILDFCLSELERTKQRWEEMTLTNIQGITSDMMRIITNLCIVTSAVATLGDPDDRRVWLTVVFHLPDRVICHHLDQGTNGTVQG
jgi:ataxia telangiectasia mutated family protein